jgi:predicted acylesterase/phospholipase RssA
MEVNKKNYPRVLVIGPGGVKGLMILGFLSSVEDYGLFEYIDTYCGVSIGAVISLLIIIGYKIRDIIEEFVLTDILKDITITYDIKNYNNNKLLISNESLRRKLSGLILNKMGSIPSLYELYMKTGKSLIATTLNITDDTTEYMSPFTHGKISCIDALMYSMNRPFLYQLMDKNGKIYVDGILANPYPINIFDDNYTEILGVYVKTGNNYNDCCLYKLFNTAMNQRIIDNIKRTTEHCHNIELLITYNNLNIMTMNDIADLLVLGFNSGLIYINKLINNTIIINPKQNYKYNYPEYYILKNNQ